MRSTLSRCLPRRRPTSTCRACYGASGGGADLSQRELADSLHISKAAVAAAEKGTRGLEARALARATELAGLRLVVVDAAGYEVVGMSPDAVRDGGGRHFPAHLDTRYVEDGWWHDNHHYGRRRPW